MFNYIVKVIERFMVDAHYLFTSKITMKPPLATSFAQRLFAQAFTLIFFFLAVVIMVSTLTTAVQDLLNDIDIIQVVIQVVNSSIIAIAVFELAMVVGEEFGKEAETDVIYMLRRTLPRFIGTVCIALSLEGLILVIKYSQLDMAGNLYYPVAIIVSAALLLTALGVFLKLVPAK